MEPSGPGSLGTMNGPQSPPASLAGVMLASSGNSTWSQGGAMIALRRQLGDTPGSRVFSPQIDERLLVLFQI